MKELILLFYSDLFILFASAILQLPCADGKIFFLVSAKKIMKYSYIVLIF
jgi:hypothetical protein